jgi:hypothetical protein
MAYGQPPPQKSRSGLIIGIVVGIVVLLLICCCGGIIWGISSGTIPAMFKTCYNGVCRTGHN